MTTKKITEIFSNHELFMGRMISASKSLYKDKNPENKIIFNANIVTIPEGKIWWGDLDVTKSFEQLKNIADEIERDLYILTELDGRFENENLPADVLSKRAVVLIPCDKYET